MLYITFFTNSYLILAIVAMFAAQGQILTDNLALLWIITVPILLFFYNKLCYQSKGWRYYEVHLSRLGKF